MLPLLGIVRAYALKVIFMKPVAEIRDPIHGYILITDVEKALIDNPVFQRLHYIRQLAGAHYVYPGADHSRFSHSLGVMHLAGVMANYLMEKGYLDVDDVQMIRIAGLLHDIGHGPFSHVYEELLVAYKDKTHEDLTEWLITETIVKDILNDHGYDPNKVAKLSVGKLNNKEKLFINQIISSPFDADKMDFLVRDSHFTGVEYGYIDIYRLIYSLDVVEDNLAIRLPGALQALEAFIIARYEMFKAVYFHRTVRSVEVMILKAMDFAKEDLNLLNFNTPNEFLRLDDSWVLVKLREIAHDPSLQKTEELKIAAKYYSMLESRNLLKCAYETILHVRDSFMINLLMKPRIRHQLETEIAAKANIDPSMVIIDFPTVPSIPYTPRQLEPFDVPVFEVSENGKRVRRRISDISELVNVLRGYMDVARIYTFPEYRKVVAQAARETFGSSSLLSVSL